MGWLDAATSLGGSPSSSSASSSSDALNAEIKAQNARLELVGSYPLEQVPAGDYGDDGFFGDAFGYIEGTRDALLGYAGDTRDALLGYAGDTRDAIVDVAPEATISIVVGSVAVIAVVVGAVLLVFKVL